MKIRWMCAMLVASLLGSGAHAADVAVVTRSQSTRVTAVQPDQPIARLATRGLGYSVLHEMAGIPQRSYRVHVTCAIDETFMQTYCPTTQYEAYCPNAKIVCR